MPRDYYRREEEYSVLVVVENDEGIIRDPVVITEAKGIKSLDDVYDIRHMFSNESYYGKSSKIKVGRKIHFWCRVCRGYIGSKTIPLRIESFRFRSYTGHAAETKVEIKEGVYICKACRNHTTFVIEDPIISTY